MAELNGIKYESMYLTEKEKFIIEQYREGAHVHLYIGKSRGLSKEQARDKLSVFSTVKEVEYNGSAWVESVVGMRSNLFVTAFYNEKNTDRRQAKSVKK